MKKQIFCDAEITMKLIGGRWRLLILRELFRGPRRPGELQRALTGISKKILSQHLKEFEDYGLIERLAGMDGKVPHVDYKLTATGLSLEPVIFSMHRWAVDNGNQVRDGERRRPRSKSA
jgi:DNA-binding HxlR family transcriptional regulator